MSPTVIITAIAVARNTDLVVVGSSATLTATATYSNGTSAAITPTWSSDAVGSFTVNAAGAALAVGPGVANITAESQSVRGSTALRAVPRFEGTWQGRWQHVAFSGSGCGGLIVGDTSALGLTLTRTRDSAAGTLNLAGVMMTVSGTIAVDGTLRLSGERLPGPDQSVSDWQSTLSGDAMAGSFSWNLLRGIPPAISCRISDNLLGVVRMN